MSYLEPITALALSCSFLQKCKAEEKTFCRSVAVVAAGTIWRSSVFTQNKNTKIVYLAGHFLTAISLSSRKHCKSIKLVN